jgi:hypothetical protein
MITISYNLIYFLIFIINLMFSKNIFLKNKSIASYIVYKYEE